MNIEPQTSDMERRTRRRLFVQRVLGALAAGIFLCTLNAGAQSTNTSSAPNFESFKIIQQNNIFDPNRAGIRRDWPRPPGSQRRVVDAFALVGTMSYEKGKFAFFDGQSSQYKKVLEPGATIAGYTVKEITPNAVTMAANGKEFQMKVGTQLRNEGSSGWRLSSHVDMPTDSNSDENVESVAAQPSTPPAGSSPQMSDVLKRLMEKRQQELK